MKATDLMIGDWILSFGKPCKIIGIRTDTPYPYIKKNVGDIWYEEGMEDLAEPIPLTPEILKKNGFEKYPYKDSYWYCDEMLELFVKIVCISPIKDRELRSSLPTPTPRLTAGEDDVYIRCDYVHELQHALKLCGIEKEITL